ncbi:MAG TPA: MASE1 domain-containing protein [Vicinamibacterales bacterium]|nr:MASE1 domain-containing protein [Vicinamibacterales bacterium]
MNRRRLTMLLALTVIYYTAGVLGLRLAYVNQSVSAVWPPAGIAVGTLLSFGTGLWPAVAVGAFLVNIGASGDLGSTVLIAIGNTLEALLACWLVKRYAGGASAFTRANTVFRFAFFGGLLAPIVAASIATLALRAAHLSGADNSPLWFTWWLGDAVGILLIAPLVVMWSSPGGRKWTRARAFEMAAVVVAAAALSWLVFVFSPVAARQYPLPLLPMPILLWPAFRLGARETVAIAVLLAFVCVIATLNDLGPFVRSNPNESLLFLQAFMGLWVVGMLAVSIEVETKGVVEANLRLLNESLEQRVTARTEELSRMRDRLDEAQRIAHVGSWEWDVAANSIWWSDELFHLFQVPRVSDRTYEDWLRLVHPEDRSLAEHAVGKALADGCPFSFEHRLVWPDGTVRTIQADGHVVRDAEGRPIRLIGTGRDVTDLRHADEERMQRLREQAARVEAEDANRAKDEFLATLSHELRTPLNAALGWTQMLRDVVQEPERRSRVVELIMRNLQAQSRLVSDMMDASSIALRTLRIETAHVAMADVVRAAIDSVRDPATARRIRIETVFPPEPAYVTGDAMRLRQVVWNLVSNAAKFSRDGGTVTVMLLRDGNTVRLTVEDDGPGIDEEFMPHLFERFRQADSSVTRSHGGLGLGLAIARHLVRAHDGSITAANRADGGAVFTVELPVAVGVESTT